MPRSLVPLAFLFTFVILSCTTSTVSADDARAKAIQQDRNRIAGTWQIVALTVNGNRSQDEDLRKLTVVNGADGTWSLRSEDHEIVRGTTGIDPTLQPKTIDIHPTTGNDQGKTYPGIYELNQITRKLCFAPPGKDRPTAFNSTAENQYILVEFERKPPKQKPTAP